MSDTADTITTKEIVYSPLTTEAAINLNATNIGLLHPDHHDDLFEEKGIDTSDPSAIARCLADEANEWLSDRAIISQHNVHIADGTGVKSVYVNAKMSPSQNQGNPKRTHYLKTVIGGAATDPEVKAAREFANGGLPDIKKNTAKGLGWFLGGGSMHKFQFNGGVSIKSKGRNKAKPRNKKS